MSTITSGRNRVAIGVALCCLATPALALEMWAAVGGGGDVRTASNKDSEVSSVSLHFKWGTWGFALGVAEASDTVKGVSDSPVPHNDYYIWKRDAATGPTTGADVLYFYPGRVFRPFVDLGYYQGRSCDIAVSNVTGWTYCQYDTSRRFANAGFGLLFGSRKVFGAIELTVIRGAQIGLGVAF